MTPKIHATEKYLRVETVEDMDIWLTPDEAREHAANLVHFADALDVEIRRTAMLRAMAHLDIGDENEHS